jgi:AAA domain-containing protein
LRGAEDAITSGEAHLAELAGTQRVPPVTRLTRTPRLRRLGRRLWLLGVWVQEGVLRAWQFAWNPRRLLGRWRAHARLWRPRQTFSLWNVSLILLTAVIGALLFARPKDPLGTHISLSFASREPLKTVLQTLFTTAVIGLIVAFWNDLFRCPWLGRRIRRRMRKDPACVLHAHLGARRVKLVPVNDPLEFVPRVEFLDEVLDGVLARDRKSVQIVVGEPGSGKTTALIQLAETLARIGVLPVVVPLRDEQQAEDLIRLAREQLREQIEPFVRSDGESDLLWRWLCRRQRVAILVDDADQIGPDGERGYTLRRTLEDAATRELPIVVTARPAGVPAGIAASSIELGGLEDATAAGCVEEGARKDPAFRRSTQIPRRALEDWIREGELAEVPFYLELLAHLVAAGRCPKLPSPDPHALDAEQSGRYRRTPDGGHRWNRLWVRFLLLEHFYDDAAAGRVRRWLGIEAGECRTTMVALEGAALGMLASTGLRGRPKPARLDGNGLERVDSGAVREHIEEFIESRDREVSRREKKPAALHRGGADSPTAPRRGGADEHPAAHRGDVRACEPAQSNGHRRPGVSAHEIIDTGERLRILDCDPRGEIQFRHRIMQAYLAGSRLAVIEHERVRHSDCKARGCASPASKDKLPEMDWVACLLDRRHPEKLTAQMALTFAALSAHVETGAQAKAHTSRTEHSAETGAQANAATSCTRRGAETGEDDKEANAWRGVVEEIERRLLESASCSLRAKGEQGIPAPDYEHEALGAVPVARQPVWAAAALDATDALWLPLPVARRWRIGGPRAKCEDRDCEEGELSDAIDPRLIPDPENRTDPDEALAKLATAAEIACATRCNLGEDPSQIVMLVRASHFATRWTKLAAIRAISQLAEPSAAEQSSWDCIWEFARDQDYLVRHAASGALEANAFLAFKALRKEIRTIILQAAERSALGRTVTQPDLPGSQQALAPAGAPCSSCGDGDGEGDGEGEGDGASSWGETEVLKLKALAWILPAIVSGLREDPATHALEAWRGHSGQALAGERPSRSDSQRLGRAADDYACFPGYVREARMALEQLVALGFQGGQHGLEEALAIGFKGDAMRHAHGNDEPVWSGSRRGESTAGPESIAGPGWVASNRRLVLEVCIERAESWYARLLLGQALALYTIAGANREEALDAFARLVHRGRERHPFTQRGTRLARAAILRTHIGGARWHAFLWDDEGPLAGGRQATLNRPTAQLLADVTVLLDLKEGSPDDRREPFAAMRELPYCLSDSRDRGEILGKGCPDSCGWGFCPYKMPPPDEPNAHRGVTRAFCREQQRYARHHRLAWQRDIRRHRLRDFWREMEHRART